MSRFFCEWKELVKNRGSAVICENKLQVSNRYHALYLERALGHNLASIGETFFPYFFVVLLLSRSLLKETKLEPIFAVCGKSHFIEISL